MIDALPLLLGPEGYQISRSVRLRSSASAYFNRTPGSASNRTTWTWSAWVKRGKLSDPNASVLFAADNATNQTVIRFRDTDTLQFGRWNGSTYDFDLRTTAVFRDPSAYYHVMVVYDSGNATSSSRALIYINGSLVTAYGTASYPSSSFAADINSTYTHGVGAFVTSTTKGYFDGYLTEINFIDGQALTPSAFGETDAITGVWKPKKYAGTYGTNGFFLNFSDNSSNTAATIGKDYSGNGNNWTPNNISVTSGSTYDSMLDVPTQWADGGNWRGNYAVLNAASIGADATVSAGNLQIAYGSSGTIGSTMATFGMSSGKWYWEITTTASSLASTGAMYGVTNGPSASDFPQYPGYNANGWAYHGNNGSKYNNATGTSYGATYGVNDVIGVAFDADAGSLTFYKNGTSQGTAFSGMATGTYFPAVGDGSSGNTFTAAFNFGQRPFSYTPPSGFKALNTLNLPAPTILKGNQYFDAVTYAGSASQQTITTSLVGLDFAWIKNRTTARDHVLVDTVRGGSPLLTLYSDLTAAEDNSSPNYNPTSFTTSGIVLGGAKLGINNAGENFVLWGWKEGATQGFDIVTYTGNGTNRTIAHSLGVAPSMMIVKRRTTAGGDWDVYHSATGATKRLFLNTTAASQTTSVAWNDTAPTSSVFTVGTGANVNQNGDTYVAYLWSEVAGFSKFGSYTGNGSTDGPFVFCGFRPRFIMFKRTDSSASWRIIDTAREAVNATQNEIYPNLSNAEAGAANGMDILSNGFKLRGSYAEWNASGGTYVFAAFAESPFKNSLAR